MDSTITKKRQLYVILILLKKYSSFRFRFFKRNMSVNGRLNQKIYWIMAEWLAVVLMELFTRLKFDCMVPELNVWFWNLIRFLFLCRICGVKRIELRFGDTKSISSISKRSSCFKVCSLDVFILFYKKFILKKNYTSKYIEFLRIYSLASFCYCDTMVWSKTMKIL